MIPKYLKQIFMAGAIIALVVTCTEKRSGETILEGKVTILTDETLTPIVEDQIAVFESEYNAKIKLISLSEAETVNALLKDSNSIAILSRKLTTEEMKVFERRKIIPKITKFATDGIALIRNRKNNDTLVRLDDVLDFLKGKSVKGIKGIAFDNPNSSTARYLYELAGIKTAPSQGVFSFHNNEEAIKYIAENEGMIGVIGLNWIVQPSPKMRNFMDKISILSIKDKDSTYYSPTQNNIGEGKYPLARDLFVVNCQGFSGLGMGFASFVAGERGQRIILKSGLLPAKIPGRKIVIRKSINKEN